MILKENIQRLDAYFNKPLDKKKEEIVFAMPYSSISHYIDYLKKEKRYFDRGDEELGLLDFLDSHDYYMEKIPKILKTKHPIWFDMFKDWFWENYKRLFLDEDFQYLPIYMYADLIGYVKNDFVVHFSDNAENICKEGFRFGANSVKKLLLTTKLKQNEKSNGGFNFAFSEDGLKTQKLYYGGNAVICRVSGIEIHHELDNENQVIFYKNSPKDFYLLKYKNNLYELINPKNGKTIDKRLTVEDAFDRIRDYEDYKNGVKTYLDF